MIMLCLISCLFCCWYRHDYKGVMEDLIHWWPKLKPGGMMAGHDYTLNMEPRGEIDDPHKQGQNWTVNFDGTIDQYPDKYFDFIYVDARYCML